MWKDSGTHYRNRKVRKRGSFNVGYAECEMPVEHLNQNIHGASDDIRLEFKRDWG